MSRSVQGAWNLVLLILMVYLGSLALGKMASPWTIAAIIAVWAIAPFIIGPVVIHRTQWSSLEPGLVPFDPDGPESPEVLRSHFTTTAAELHRLGFMPTRYYRT